MFRLRHLRIDTLSEHVVFIQSAAQLEFARAYAAERPDLIAFGF